MLTAYDYTLASLLDAAGVEGILVGDSLSMVVQGHDTTLPVTLDEMIYHAEMVGRAVKRALVVVDMPFPTFHLGRHKAVEDAGRILKETRCQAVKLEGGVDQAEVIAALVSAGIPVMAHGGLRPQTVHQLGRLQGAARPRAAACGTPRRPRTPAPSRSCWSACRPSWRPRSRRRVKIPTIGIGAGAGCDGQVLVTHDLLGLTVRLRAAVREDLRRPEGHHHGRRDAVSGRSPQRRVSGEGADV